MKFIAVILSALTLTASIAGCEGQGMKPISSVEEGVHLVDSFRGNPQDFQLAVPDSLLDPVGINMAIITDRVLARGWQPDGFTQAQGLRVFRYKGAQVVLPQEPNK